MYIGRQFNLQSDGSNRVNQTGTLRKLALVLLFLILLPALFYSGYELSSMNSTEEMVAGIYRQQLDVVLFSINQYAWDIASNWSSGIGIAVNELRNEPAESLRTRLERFLHDNSSITSISISDSSLSRATTYTTAPRISGDIAGETGLLRGLNLQRDKIDRLIRFHDAQYRKLEPITTALHEDTGHIALMFIAGAVPRERKVITITIDGESFIRNLLASRLQEAAGEDFILAVTRKDRTAPVYSTATIQSSDLRQTKPLWLFPDHLLGIRMKGTTIDELARNRFSRNLIFVLLLDIVLIAGAWMIYRNIRREMLFLKMKSDFVSNVSHELRTPLALIRMYAETLDMGRLRDEGKRKEYYSTILQESERLTRLVNNILDFSRMEAGRKKYNFADVQVNDIVTGALGTYRFHLQSEGFTPEVNLDPALPVIRGDAESVTEAVMNIIDNAVKYSGDRKYLSLRTGRIDGDVFLDVQDQGIGIAPEHHTKIFDTFFRVSDVLVHNVKGSGLGLALVRHIMNAHGGSVSVESSPGNGSRFRLRFPGHTATQSP
jgi:two-component system phosphate regulon sensor histidine kinase PhoR